MARRQTLLPRLYFPELKRFLLHLLLNLPFSAIRLPHTVAIFKGIVFEIKLPAPARSRL